MRNGNHLAVLIDADNVSSKYVKGIFDELSKDWDITYKRIYGDWTDNKLASWKNTLLKNSIAPVQQYGYTVGKNSTDSAMIIDAMDILYTGNVEGFCVVSSDSDFTRLASRLRESGMSVIGMGEKKTPVPFINACNRFVYLEVLEQDDDKEKRSGSPSNSAPALDESITPREEIIRAIASIIDETSNDEGWAHLSNVGSILSKRYPDFDVRNYGQKKLSSFVKSLNRFRIKLEKSKNTNTNLLYVQNAESA